jgi:hypothetical protein
MSDQPVARPLPNTNTEYTQTDFHVSGGKRNQDPSLRTSEGSSSFRLLGHCDRLI